MIVYRNIKTGREYMSELADTGLEASGGWERLPAPATKPAPLTPIAPPAKADSSKESN